RPMLRILSSRAMTWALDLATGQCRTFCIVVCWRSPRNVLLASSHGRAYQESIVKFTGISAYDEVGQQEVKFKWQRTKWFFTSISKMTLCVSFWTPDSSLWYNLVTIQSMN